MIFILAAMMAMSAIAPTGDMCVPDGSGSDDWPYVVWGNPTFGPDVTYVILEVIKDGEVWDETFVSYSGENYSFNLGYNTSIFPIRVIAKSYDSNNNYIGVKRTPYLTADDFVQGYKILEYVWSPYCVRNWIAI